MEKGDLQTIIDQLASGNSKDEAYFAIFQYGGGPDESFVKANKQGLTLFAASILKASRDFDEVVVEGEKANIPLDYKEAWVDGDTFLYYVEPAPEKRENVTHEFHTETWKDQVMKVGCVAGLILAAIALVVGLITMVKWFF